MRPEEIRKLAETYRPINDMQDVGPDDVKRLIVDYRPNLDSLTDKLAQGPLRGMFIKRYPDEEFAQMQFTKEVGLLNYDKSIALTQDAIARMMRK